VVLRRDSVPREYTLAFIQQFAPHLGRHELRRALAGEPPRDGWAEVPHWREREGWATAQVA
jgi:hypothetical protein